MCTAQEWIAYAQTKTARHKLAKFLKDHADLVDPESAPDVAFREASETQDDSAASQRALSGQEAGTQVRSANHLYGKSHAH